MNRTLEKMAAAIFKSWFIDFDPVHAKVEGRDPNLPAEIAELFPNSFVDSALGPIPKGWKVSTIGEHMLNFDSKRVPVSGAERAKRKGPYPYHGAATVMDHVDDYLFDGIYLLVGEDGSVVQDSGIAVTQYVWGRIWVNNHAHVLQGKGQVSTEQLYLYFHFQPVAPYVTGAVQPKLSQGRMNKMPFAFPGEEVCEAFGKTIGPLFAKLRANASQIKILGVIRDTLLPKLLSGEIDVSAIEDLGGEVAETAESVEKIMFETRAETVIYTVGHSNHPIDRFIGLLRQHSITAIADVRSAPYSRRNPQFNTKPLTMALKKAGITYVFLGEELGARPKDASCYNNGRVDFGLLAARDVFQRGIERVLRGSSKYRLALMCAEKEPLDCHRTILVCCHLRERGVGIKHILADGSIEEHRKTEVRLLRATGLEPTLFSSVDDDSKAIAQAYARRAIEIAFKNEKEEPTHERE
jgi:type I restriction enzyme S subunit